MEFLPVCLNNLKESKNKLLVLSFPNKPTAGHVNLNCSRLEVSRNYLCIRTLKKIEGKGPLSKHLTLLSVERSGLKEAFSLV